MNDIYSHALKLLSGRDYTIESLRRKLEARFGTVPDDVIDLLVQKGYLNDRRYAEIYVARRKRYGPARLREELRNRGVPEEITHDVISQLDLPSLKDALKATMTDWKLRPPLSSRDAARLFRALSRLEYDEDAIREEIKQFHDQ